MSGLFFLFIHQTTHHVEPCLTFLELFVHKAMVSYYHNYLKKLSHNYEDLSMCFHFDEQYQTKLMQNNISPLHSLSKLQNILRYLIHVIIFDFFFLPKFHIFFRKSILITKGLLISMTTTTIPPTFSLYNFLLLLQLFSLHTLYM